MNIRERNHRAREYSRYCFRVRLVKRMWLVAAVLWAMLIAAVIWVLTLPKPKEAPPPSPAVVEIADVTAADEPGNLLVCDITGYCACCTPYADINRNASGQVLTASGKWVEIGQAVAVDPEIIPLGSKVTIGSKTYIAADTGVYGYTVDILMDHDDAAVAGVRRELVTWETA